MITRYGGGNNGVAEYLENGRKAEREYTREELDHRLILDGDLQTTNKIIQSIEDKGQMRYLHITLSFQESEISAETLNAVTQEYKTLFMNAYHEDEYCFYAEAHLPKIKNIVDVRTGEPVERKPHIHIVIPRTNLATEKSLNPVGDLTNTKTQEQLDAIQEHINNKYNLASPKDAVRVSDNNYANVLSRTKGDIFNERNSDVKRDVYARLENENIRSFSDFKTLLSEYGEVKARNAGKAGEYLSVKLDGDKKFTNLKNPLFSRQYVESRELPLIKPTEKQISARIEAWTSRASHEIKHIYPASARIREVYKSLADHDRKTFLNERINNYDHSNKLNKEHAEPARGRQGSHERSFDPSSRLDRVKTGIGLPRMPQRGLVYGINGRAAPTESVSVLPDNVERDLAKRLQDKQHAGSEMRRDFDRGQQERGLKTVEKSFFVNDLLLNKLNEDAERNERATMSKIRKEIDPERFLSAVASEFNVNAASHAVSKAQDGSPRFSVGNRNLNASDFLTKHLNLSWSDAKQFLLKTFEEQKTHEPVKNSSETLRKFIREEKNKMYADLREMRKELRSVPASDREVAKGELVYKKLTTLESLAEIEKEGQNAIAAYSAPQQPEDAAQEATEQPKEAVYFVKFPKPELNEHIRPFNSALEAINYGKTVSVLHGIDADEASVQAVDKVIAETKGLHEAVKGAVAVPRHELERAQEPKEVLYFVQFPNDVMKKNIKIFDSLQEAAAYGVNVSDAEGLKIERALIMKVDKNIVASKGFFDARYNAITVPRYEQENAKGNAISKSEASIMDAIDKYQDKHFSEGIGFNREEIESELLNHNLTIDFAESRLEHKFKEEKTRCNEQERDNGMER